MNTVRTNAKKKIIILTDSIANPRSFPVECAVSLEQTYPYLLREEYPESIFWQLSYGNRTTEELTNQAISYLNDWEPDYIIIQSGIIDCRPEAFTEIQKSLINSFTGSYFRFLKKHLYNPRLIKYRQVKRVSKRSYKKTLTKFKLIFSDSRILVSEIFTGEGYDTARPGVKKLVKEYNEISRQIFNNNIVQLQDKLNSSDGFIEDDLHLNVKGHRIVAQEIIKKMNESR